jgi:hypothetical protein
MMQSVSSAAATRLCPQVALIPVSTFLCFEDPITVTYDCNLPGKVSTRLD